MPKISDATQFTEPSKLKIFTICTDGERAPWLAFLEKNKMKNWVNVLDEKPDSDIQKNYATWNLPVIYLLDKDKRIVAKRLKAENLPDLLRVLFSEKK